MDTQPTGVIKINDEPTELLICKWIGWLILATFLLFFLLHMGNYFSPYTHESLLIIDRCVN